MRLKMYFCSFDYAYNWYVKDAKGNELATFSTAAGQWHARTIICDRPPARVDIWSPSNDTASVDISGKNGTFVGVTGGNGKPVAMSHAMYTPN